MPAPREVLAAWRRLGPRRFVAAALRALVAVVRPHARRARVRYAPPRASRRAVAKALGGVDGLAAVRAAMPTVVAWEAELEADRDSILARADAVAAHRFDLLGSGPTDLGPEIPWRRDFKTGAEWPLHHISRVPIVLGGGSDIKVPWELSRAQHLPLLAAAHRLTGDPRYRDELGAQLESWIAANPVERGPNWACTMDVAIRAANWLAALALLPERPPWLDRVAGSLLLHGRFIRANLEWGEVRGNHYLSDVVGLLPVAALFNGSREGRGWATWAARELEREMAHQVRADGCDHEMSIPYHRLVCELFICGAQHAEALVPGALSAQFHERLALMLQFAADHERPDGLSPQAGDADSGRYLPLGDYGADQRDHRHLFAQAGRPAPAPRGHADYPHGGWYVMRHDDLWAMVRCGDVGLEGVGAHAHNDQLSFELCLGGQPLVVDPGSYLYTADPVARNAFRATAAHATLEVDGREQNPLRSDYLFAVEDRAHARATAWEVDGPRAAFAGEHHGFAPIVHRRRVAFDGEAHTLTLDDEVSGGGERLRWSFQFAPGAEVTVDGTRATARWPTAELTLEAPEGVSWTVEDGWVSPAYGIREPAPVLRAHSGARERTRLTLTAVHR